nr:MAG TPA: hypothetical protein [Caudoviricetes sp.]
MYVVLSRSYYTPHTLGALLSAFYAACGCCY